MGPVETFFSSSLFRETSLTSFCSSDSSSPRFCSMRKVSMPFFFSHLSQNGLFFFFWTRLRGRQLPPLSQARCCRPADNSFVRRAKELFPLRSDSPGFVAKRLVSLTNARTRFFFSPERPFFAAPVDHEKVSLSLSGSKGPIFHWVLNPFLARIELVLPSSSASEGLSPLDTAP